MHTEWDGDVADGRRADRRHHRRRRRRHRAGPAPLRAHVAPVHARAPPTSASTSTRCSPRPRASARTTPTSRWPCAGASASRPATCPATSSPRRTPPAPTSTATRCKVQTHAWFEAAIPGWGWLALDPTNAQQVGPAPHHDRPRARLRRRPAGARRLLRRAAARAPTRSSRSAATARSSSSSRPSSSS